ncbi:uncharacterized protein [Lolium perenne]|uniref:uncharacterized protein n=1 Tax=Lolium perenne TaxID=4522 RepID=UPI0021F6743E|nr:uncharacterized protein LOC127341921 [Lolium perenne]
MSQYSWEHWQDYERQNWRDKLRDINFWLNGHSRAGEYISSGYSGISQVTWNVETGPMASFTRARSSIIADIIKRGPGFYEHVIKVDLKPTPTAEEAQGRGITSIKYQVTLAAAKELGLLDQEYNSLKEKHDQLQYCTYGCDERAAEDLEYHMRYVIPPLVIRKLSNKRYLLVVDNLQWPITRESLTSDCGLPPPVWTKSRWLISPTSLDAYNASKSEDDGASESMYRDVQVVFLTIIALRQSAEHIRLNMISQESIEYWHVIALDCFHYAMAIFAKHSQVAAVTSDELTHQWATLLPCMTDSNSISSKCSYMHQVGRVILEAFQKYSLLELPFSPAYEAREATNTAAQFLAYHGLIAEGITIDEVSDNKKKWISFSGDDGCHVSREWLLSKEDENIGTIALILRGCSQQSLILSKLNHFLPKLCFLRVLDLSYTPIKSLPSSIHYLKNLRLLSVRGCHDLKILSSSSRTSVTDSTKSTSSPLSTLYQIEILDLNGVPLSHLTQDVANQKTNLIHLDMSHSEITTFPSKFFQDMSNLEDLILVNCSNLVEIPPSMAALSSLTTLEITGTQIKYFPQKIFEEMQKLQLLKLIDNNNLISLTRPISRVHEFKLEGHPNLKSFSLIGSPHIQLLSLRGCRELKSVEFKNLGALEELDLSGTSIDEIPADIPSGTHLRKLLLLGVPSLLRFPWHMLERLPEVFYLDQCTEGNGNHFDQGLQLCVSDPRFFYSFGKSCVDFVRDGKFFQSFYVRVAPCSANNRRLQHDEGMVDDKLRELVQNQSTYVDVHNSCYAEEIAVALVITVPLRRTERHVEITGMQQRAGGLFGLLNVTKSISVTFDTSIDRFDRCSNFDDLEKCELRWCHKMEGVFNGISDMENLRNVHVCNLRSLLWFCQQYSKFSFSSLEHLHLEYCPRLEAMMPDGVTLPSLKTLDILFCYNLKKIFYRDTYPGDKYQLLPNLQRVRLQELPLLQQFNDKDTTITSPMWKELHVRGCWSFRCLPHLHGQLKTVKVNGERSWWSKLRWGSLSHRNSYEPKLPPEFASFDERAGVTSYLR